MDSVFNRVSMGTRVVKSLQSIANLIHHILLITQQCYLKRPSICTYDSEVVRLGTASVVLVKEVSSR